MSVENHKPPKIADRLLAWYCSPRVREQVQGDAHELYYWRLAEKGHKQAGRAFIWDVIRLFKWSNIKRKKRQNQKINNIAMFKNYFKIGLRNLWKQRMSSVINIIGLSLAIGCCIVAFIFIEQGIVKDRFHKNGDQIYLVTHTALVDGSLDRYGYLSAAISDLLKEEYSEIKHVVNYGFQGVAIKMGNRTFGDRACFVGSDFFKTFTFPLKYGDEEALAQKNAVVISESAALRFFGDEFPLGKSLDIELNNQAIEGFVVTGVMQDIARNSSLRPHILLNYEVFAQDKERKDLNPHVFIELEKNVSLDGLVNRFAQTVQTQHGLNPGRKYESIGLLPIDEMASKSQEINQSIGSMPPMAGIIMLGVIGIFMLILSTFNYINIATLMATKRMKEVGIRKVIGAKKGQLVIQFLCENFILCALALVLGFLLGSSLFLPWFNIIAGLDMRLDILAHAGLRLFLFVLWFALSLISGAYPAFFVSRLMPAKILKGSEKLGGKTRFTSVLLTFQFVLSIITIVASIMFVQTNQANSKRDWGYDQYNKLIVHVPNYSNYLVLKNEYQKHPNIEDMAGSRGGIGRFSEVVNASIGEEELSIQVIRGDLHFPEFMGLRLKEGRLFDQSTKSDISTSVIVNETFMSTAGLDFRQDQLITIDSTNYHIVGIVEDFHTRDFGSLINSTIVMAMPDSMATTLILKIPENEALRGEMMDEIRAIWESNIQEQEFRSELQEDIFQRYFDDVKGVKNVIIFTASLAVLLSAMGLFGLVSLSVSGQIKDFGIKKILGANGLQMGKAVYKKFAIILGLAILIGSSLSILIIGQLLDTVFGYHETIGVFSLLLTSVILLTIAGLTIKSQVLKVQRLNPAETLRVE